MSRLGPGSLNGSFLAPCSANFTCPGGASPPPSPSPAPPSPSPGQANADQSSLLQLKDAVFNATSLADPAVAATFDTWNATNLPCGPAGGNGSCSVCRRGEPCGTGGGGNTTQLCAFRYVACTNGTVGRAGRGPPTPSCAAALERSRVLSGTRLQGAPGLRVYECVGLENP